MFPRGSPNLFFSLGFCPCFITNGQARAADAEAHRALALRRTFAAEHAAVAAAADAAEARALAAQRAPEQTSASDERSDAADRVPTSIKSMSAQTPIDWASVASAVTAERDELVATLHALPAQFAKEQVRTMVAVHSLR